MAIFLSGDAYIYIYIHTHVKLYIVPYQVLLLFGFIMCSIFRFSVLGAGC